MSEAGLEQMSATLSIRSRLTFCKGNVSQGLLRYVFLLIRNILRNE